MWLAIDSVAHGAAAWLRERSHYATAHEHERAHAIGSPLRRAQFLAGRWLATQVLAKHFGGAPEVWQMSCEPGEPPRVIDGPSAVWPRLSIAHRGDTVACAVADRPLGIDVEIEGRMRGSDDERAAFVLTPTERLAFARVAPDQRERFLLARWTLKEAWAKRSGRGLELGDMPRLGVQALVAGGNARLWRAGDLVVALCAESEGPWAQPVGHGIDLAPAQPWQVGPVNRRH